MRRINLPLIRCLVVLLPAWLGLAPAGARPRLQRLEPARWLEHLRFLGDDALGGRSAGSEGAAHAADYLAARLREYGLKAPSGEGYFQPVPMRGSTALPGSQLIVSTGKETRRLALNRDYLLYRMGAETFVPAPVPLVFAGYGIVAPEFDYNSYQDLDVAGKIVVVLTGEPASNRDDFFAGAAPTVYSDPEAKHRLALSRGARGTILLPNSLVDGPDDWQSLAREFAFEDVRLAYGPVGGLSALINPATASLLFQGAEKTLQEVLELDRKNEMVSFELPARMAFHGEFHQREFVSPNVAGLIEGTDPGRRDEFVLLSAHYDGLGRGPAVRGDSIYNGVFDNAAGVSTLLELARFLAAAPPARPVVVLFLTGEEKGLLGSRYYTEHPLVPVSRTVAALNIDGIASFDTFRDVIGVGAQFSTLGQMLAEFAAERDMAVSDLASELEGTLAFNRSDQRAFAEAGIPSILILDGLTWDHADRQEALARLRTWTKTVYHTPFDDLTQPIEISAVIEHSEFLLDFSRLLADSIRVPKWHAGVPYVHARLQSIAEHR